MTQIKKLRQDRDGILAELRATREALIEKLDQETDTKRHAALMREYESITKQIEDTINHYNDEIINERVSQ